MTASGDDTHPVIQLWDLKKGIAPIFTFKGHSSGIWGLSWCPSDPDLILSAGKDKTLCWNLSTGETQSQIETSGWNFDAQWSSRAGLLSACSFDSFDIYSVQDFSYQSSEYSDFQVKHTLIKICRSFHIFCPPPFYQQLRIF